MFAKNMENQIGKPKKKVHKTSKLPPSLEKICAEATGYLVMKNHYKELIQRLSICEFSN